MSANPTLLVPLGNLPSRANSNAPFLLSQIWYDRCSTSSPSWHMKNKSARQSPSRSMKALKCGLGNRQENEPVGDDETLSGASDLQRGASQ